MVGECAPLRRLIGPGPPQLEDAMDRPAGAPENNWWWPQLHPRLADHPAPGQRDDRRHDFRRFSGEDGRTNGMLATGACAGPWAAWLGWNLALLAAASPCSWGQLLTAAHPVNLAAEQDLRPRRTPSKRWCQPAPARDPSPPPGRAGRCWTMARDALRRKGQSSTSAAGSAWGAYRGTRNPAKRGNPLAASTGSGLGGPCNGFPRDSMPVSGDLAPPLPRPGDGDKLERRNRLETASDLRENPRGAQLRRPGGAILSSKNRKSSRIIGGSAAKTLLSLVLAFRGGQS